MNRNTPLTRRRLAKAAAFGLLLGANAACEQPAKSAADTKDGGTANEPLDRSGAADKAHCGGKGE